MKNKQIGILFLAMFFSGQVLAEDLVGDRPDFTESALAVPDGTWQLEAGFTVNSQEEVSVFSLGEILLRRGISETMELRFVLPSYFQISYEDSQLESNKGQGNAAIGFKHELKQGDGATPQLAVLSHLIMPWGHPSVSDLDYASNAVLAAEWGLNNVGLGVNAGGEAVFTDDTEFNKWFSASLAYGASERLGLYVEAYTLIDDESNSANFVNAGMTVLVNPDLKLDLRVGSGSSDDQDETYFGAGVVTRF